MLTVLGIIGVVGAIAGAVGGVLGAIDSTNKANDQATYQQNQATVDNSAREQATADQLTSMNDQLNMDKLSVANKAADSGLNSYLQNIQSEAGFMDLMQQNTEGLGSLASANALSGTKQNLTLKGVVASQMESKQNLARNQIDRSREQAITENLRDRSTFNEGSAYMTAYRNRIKAIENQNAYGDQAYTNQHDYLQNAINDSSWGNWVNWATVGATGLAGAGNVANAWSNFKMPGTTTEKETTKAALRNSKYNFWSK